MIKFTEYKNKKEYTIWSWDKKAEAYSLKKIVENRLGMGIDDIYV